jgi:hypothetical protein
MKCGLRSKAAAVKSCQTDAMEVIILKRWQKVPWSARLARKAGRAIRGRVEVRRLKFLERQTSRLAFLARLARRAIEEESRFGQDQDLACRIA